MPVKRLLGQRLSADWMSAQQLSVLVLDNFVTLSTRPLPSWPMTVL